MDTTRKVSASTITGFLQSEDENVTMPQGEEGRPSQRPQHPRHLRHPEQQQLYHPPPPAYYPYYPPPLPVVPSLSYVYMDLLKHMTMQNEIRSYLPKVEESAVENKPKDSQSKTNRWLQHEVQKKECDNSHHNDGPGPSRGFSRLCVSCEQHFRCSCCSKPLTTDMSIAANDHSYQQKSYCHCLLPFQSLMHIHPNQVLSCNCVCQKQKEVKTKRKSKQKSNKNKCNQMCLQSDHTDIPERDNPHPPKLNRGKTSKKTYCKDDTGTQESSDSDENCSQRENKREGYESDYKSEEDTRFGFYAGEGDENKMNSNAQKSEVKKNRLRKTRRSLAYFINV